MMSYTLTSKQVFNVIYCQPHSPEITLFPPHFKTHSYSSTNIVDYSRPPHAHVHCLRVSASLLHRRCRRYRRSSPPSSYSDDGTAQVSLARKRSTLRERPATAGFESPAAAAPPGPSWQSAAVPWPPPPRDHTASTAGATPYSTGCRYRRRTPVLSHRCIQRLPPWPASPLLSSLTGSMPGCCTWSLAPASISRSALTRPALSVCPPCYTVPRAATSVYRRGWKT